MSTMVSILVPVYNAASYLEECLKSLVGQTYADLQIVMINDGSTDDSWAVMQRLSRQDSRIEIYSQPNSGVAATRNRLLDKVRGDFVLFVDSDDWIEPQTVECLMTEQAKGNYDMVVYQFVNALANTDGLFTRELAVKLFLEHKHLNGSLCNKLIRSSLFKGLYFDETVTYGEDAMMVWQVLQRVQQVRIINQHLYHVRVNADSLSRRPFNKNKCSVYTVWDYICGGVDDAWPQYSDLAHARGACELTLVLRDAVKSGYNDRTYIKHLQEVIRRDEHLIRATGISSFKMSAFAWLVSHHYNLARLLAPYIK